MKKNFTSITLIFTALVMLMAGPASAAKIKAVVTSAATTHDQVCAEVSDLTAGKAGTECAIDSSVTSAVILNTKKKLSMKEGQDVILKSKDTGKVMASVTKIIPADGNKSELNSAVGNNGAVIIKGGKGSIAVITPEKPFAPEKDSKVTLKTKQKQAIEGC
jgi:hypothetical protein